MRLIQGFGLALLIAACGSPTDVPDGPPAADGTVITVSGTSVHIRAAAEQCGIVFRVTSDTRILEHRPDGGNTRVSLAEITTGRRAQGWADGPIAESCPAQAAAAVVLLL
jgi:hypothetical protein